MELIFRNQSIILPYEFEIDDDLLLTAARFRHTSRVHLPDNYSRTNASQAFWILEDLDDDFRNQNRMKNC